MSETQFRQLPLNAVVVSPTNPRKTFDVSKTTELAESIREKGVLQPILVREKGNKFEIVCGERRFRASQMVNVSFPERETIPAIIRELSDQEVREMQLIENFQREDVHPMEEAVAIKYAVETGQYSMEDLRLKVGKSITYIKQRMKLNDLSENWQKLFFNGNLNISAALQIAMFTNDVQDTILEDRFDFDELMADPKEKIHHIDSWTFNQYRGKLSDASFDLTDETLNPALGACTNCIFNTSTYGLFPDSIEDARCTAIDCFKLKSEVHITRAIENAKEDPSIVFVSTNWSSFDNQILIDKLKKDNHIIYNRYGYEQLEEPEKPLSFDEFHKEWLEDNDGDSNGCEEAFLAEQEDYNVDLSEYQKKADSGKYLKALIVDGRGIGETILVKLNNKSGGSNSQTAAKVDPNSPDATAADIKQEIERIKAKEERSKELDAEKIWKLISDYYRTSDDIPFAAFPANNEDFTQAELNAIGYALANKIGHPYSKHTYKILGFNKACYLGYSEAEKITNVTKDDIYHLLRLYMVCTLSDSNISHIQSPGAHMLYPVLISTDYMQDKVIEIENSFKEKIEKRVARVNERIAELQVKADALKPTPKEKTAKKSSTKKAK